MTFEHFHYQQLHRKYILLLILVHLQTQKMFGRLSINADRQPKKSDDHLKSKGNDVAVLVQNFIPDGVTLCIIEAI